MCRIIYKVKDLIFRYIWVYEWIYIWEQNFASAMDFERKKKNVLFQFVFEFISES